MKTTTFERKPFTVEGVQVTAENIIQVAAWCGGVVHNMLDDSPTARPYIKVKVKRAHSDRQSQAFHGDWVLKADNGFKVYTNGALRYTFNETVQDDHDYGKVLAEG